MKFSELQKLLKDNFGIDHLADIARELGVSPQAVSNWKSRDRVPYKYVIKVRNNIKDNHEFDKDLNDKSNLEINKSFQQSYSKSSLQDDGISILDLLLVIAKGLKVIIILPIIISIITIIYVLYFIDPVYESTSKIMSSSGNSNVFSQSSLAMQLGINLPRNQAEPQWVYPEIIKSRTLANKILNRKFNTIEFGSQKSLLHILTSGESNEVSNNDSLNIKAINAVLGMVKVSESGSTIQIKINAKEPRLARDINFAFIDELDAHQRAYNKTKSSETRKFIEERIKSTEIELNVAEEDLKNFRDSNRRIQNSPSLLLEQQRLSREAAVLTGVFTTLKQELENAKIEEVKESNYVIILDPPEIPILRIKPKRKVIVLSAGILGLVLGLIIIFFNEYANRGLNYQKDKFEQLRMLFFKNIKYFIPYKFTNK
tara:strand:+ start:5533 stop:6816 length:1284 start_codon:yes stop_codon:yes gene_type:complete